MRSGVPIAIVGIGGIFPDASSPDELWKTILSTNDAARDVPQSRWILDLEEAFDPVPGMPDKVYSLKACLIDNFNLDVEGFNLDPGLIQDLDPMHHLLLHAGRQAFNEGVTKNIDRKRIGVVIGNIALPTETVSAIAVDILGHIIEEKMLDSLGRNHAISQAEGPVSTAAINRYVTGLPAGILAKALKLGGGSYTLDAACASSLYALKLAVDQLSSGRADAMLAGGLSRPDCLYTQMGFSQLRALSARGKCAPFDIHGDGLVVGEGAGLVMLKRLEDAIRDHDTIYSVIRGIGLSNDIEGNLLAPSSEGQLRAMRLAYEQAEWKPQDVELIECHATGTPVGDKVEFNSLCRLWGNERSNNHKCIIGSVKSNIGHMLTGAGVAGLIKVLLALKYKTLPPTANFLQPNPELGIEDTPFEVLSSPQDWIKSSPGGRRAAVSAFGFGGINAHVLLEEFAPSTTRKSIAVSEVGNYKTHGVGSDETRTEMAKIPRSNFFLKGVGNYKAHGVGPSKIPAVSDRPIAIVGMDVCFGPWKNLDEFQERALGSTKEFNPTASRKWWSAEKSKWLKKHNLSLKRFKGYFIDQVNISSQRYRIPPKELPELLPQQLLMLEVAANALHDAKYRVEKGFRTGVNIGIGLDLDTTNFHLRWSIKKLAKKISVQLGLNLTDSQLDDWVHSLRDSIHEPLTANRTMGALGGIVASRIARQFRIGGPSHTVSSEESSGLRAVEVAMRALQNDEIDQALVGAVDFCGDIRSLLTTHLCRQYSTGVFNKAFSIAGNGPIPGEGSAAIVLKRLDSALEDGDRIYAVIRGLGSATEQENNDLSVDSKTYELALQRAYEDSSLDPATVGLVEAHESTVPGEDSMEAKALSSFFSHYKHNSPCFVTSTKSQIGHTGAASALGSLVKTALCLYHHIIPGSGKTDPTRKELSSAVFTYAQESQYWLHNRGEGPRRAGVSSISVDGNCMHLVLEGFEIASKTDELHHRQPLGVNDEALFALEGQNETDLFYGLDQLQGFIDDNKSISLEILARQWIREHGLNNRDKRAIALVANNHNQLTRLINEARETLSKPSQPVLSPRVVLTPEPYHKPGKIAFVFPGSGNHFPGMGRKHSVLWPEIWRKQYYENLFLKDQYRPDIFWNERSFELEKERHKAFILGQVSLGTAMCDLVRSFGVEPQAVIGYSLGESAGLFSMKVWQDRDEMLKRIAESTLFTHDLAGECRAARNEWKTPVHHKINWSVGVIDRSSIIVNDLLLNYSHVYLLIINTADSCVIGGETDQLKQLVKESGGNFVPVDGVTTVHCPVVQSVADAYRQLHLFPVNVPPAIQFFSAAWARPYEITTEKAADSILAQALKGHNFPKLIERAYNEGIRIFLELGPGSSCTKMINKILNSRNYIAHAVCSPGQDPLLSILTMLAKLIVLRVPVNLYALFDKKTTVNEFNTVCPESNFVSIPTDRDLPATLPLPSDLTNPHRMTELPERSVFQQESSIGLLIKNMASAQEATTSSHQAFLQLTDNVSNSISGVINYQIGLIDRFRDQLPTTTPVMPRRAISRNLCLEFATGSIAKVLGAEFSEVDSYPTRVRLPDEPLMLVDQIIDLQGVARSMDSGKVITEHIIHPDAWYLDNGHIPTCIAVEAGQADLFLSAYLGIDFKTKGMAVYRLLDAEVTFHQPLPGPGNTIKYDICIERFFRQGETYLFRFNFKSTLNGHPLLTMENGCAGFFTKSELAAGRGVVHNALDKQPQKGKLPDDWSDLVPMDVESYSQGQITALRNGDLVSCFGQKFAGLGLKSPLTIPGGRLNLVDRVVRLDPCGGRYGLGIIKAEADIHPDDWFLTCHFKDDNVMPGTLMYECCMHTLRIYLMRMGWVGEKNDVYCEPLPSIKSTLKCRGQVTEITRKAAYQITIKELGYGPVPYAIVDALMFADGKAIVEITNMSLRICGLNKERLELLWRRRPPSRKVIEKKSAIFGYEQILSFAIGNPSEAFGAPYCIFDKDRVIARLPGPPYQFLDRITEINAEPWKMVAGGRIEAQYDIKPDSWFFKENQGIMPFSVLLEVALQPCGWLAAYLGSALTSDKDLSFRNLGGTATQYTSVRSETTMLTTEITITNVSGSGGMIIQHFNFRVSDGHSLVYEGKTYFGFFTKDALANQIGLRDADVYLPSSSEVQQGRTFSYPQGAHYPDHMLRMIDTIDLINVNGGTSKLGFIRGVKEVNPDEWFFKAHFYQDPVCPGSLGLESFLQLMRIYAIEIWGENSDTKIYAPADNELHEWIYRGQILSTDKRVTVEAEVEKIDHKHHIVHARGFLKVDGRVIYQMKNFTLKWGT